MIPYKYRAIPYVFGFEVGFFLLPFEVNNYSNTLIPPWINIGLFVFISLVAFFIIRKKPDRPFPSRPLFTLVTCALSCAFPALYIIITLNYHFASKQTRMKELPIVRKSIGDKDKRVYIYVDYDGGETMFDMRRTPDEYLEKANYLELRLRRGLLGFDIVDSSGWR